MFLPCRPCCGGVSCEAKGAEPLTEPVTTAVYEYNIVAGSSPGWARCIPSVFYATNARIIVTGGGYTLLDHSKAVSYGGTLGGYFYKPRGIDTITVRLEMDAPSGTPPDPLASIAFYCPKPIVNILGVPAMDVSATTPVTGFDVTITAEDYFFGSVLVLKQPPSASNFTGIAHLWEGSIYDGTFSMTWDHDLQAFTYTYPFDCGVGVSPSLEATLSPFIPIGETEETGVLLRFYIRNTIGTLFPWNISNPYDCNWYAIPHLGANYPTVAQTECGTGVPFVYGGITVADGTTLQSTTATTLRNYEYVDFSWKNQTTGLQENESDRLYDFFASTSESERPEVSLVKMEIANTSNYAFLNQGNHLCTSGYDYTFRSTVTESGSGVLGVSSLGPTYA